MPSHLRLQSSFEEPIATGTYQTSPQLPPKKKQRMSLTSTYMVASTARSKLGREASRADHNLRRLVGHANLLDNLMVHLQEAEKEQEAWFNQSVRKASNAEPRHVQWMDEITETDEYESDSDSEMDDEEEGMFSILPVRKMKVAPVEISSTELDEEDAEYDDESDDGLALQRTPSKHSPPELSYEEEEDSDSEDDECPSPEETPLALSEKQRQAIATTSFFDTKSPSIEDYVMQQPQTIIAAAC